MVCESLARFCDRIDPSDIVASAVVAGVLLHIGVDASLMLRLFSGRSWR